MLDVINEVKTELSRRIHCTIYGGPDCEPNRLSKYSVQNWPVSAGPQSRRRVYGRRSTEEALREEALLRQSTAQVSGTA
jgi:hypothetical protein